MIPVNCITLPVGGTKHANMKRGRPDTSPVRSPKRNGGSSNSTCQNWKESDLCLQDRERRTERVTARERRVWRVGERTSHGESRYGHHSGCRDQLPIEEASDTRKHSPLQFNLDRLATMNPVGDGHGGRGHSDRSGQPSSWEWSGQTQRTSVPTRAGAAQAGWLTTNPVARFLKVGAKREPDTFEAAAFIDKLLELDTDSISDFMDENGGFVCAVCRSPDERIWYCAVCWKRYHAGCHVPKSSNIKYNTWTCTLCDYKSDLNGPPARLSGFKPESVNGTLSEAELEVCRFLLLQLLCHRSRLSFKHPLPEMEELFSDLSDVEQKLTSEEHSRFKSINQFFDSVVHALEQAVKTYENDPKQRFCAEMLGQYFHRLASVAALLLGRAAKMKVYEGTSNSPTARFGAFSQS